MGFSMHVSPDYKGKIKSEIQASCADALRAIQFLQGADVQTLLYEMAEEIARAFSRGNKLIIAGNGGSLCDALHVAEEFTGYFRSKRPALPAIALADPGHITCVGNDDSFHEIFSRGIEAHGVEGDIFIALTTSGNSENLRRAVVKAKERGLITMSFLGKTGGVLKGVSSYELLVPGFTFSDHIQEAHMTALHIIIQAVELFLFSSSSDLE